MILDCGFTINTLMVLSGAYPVEWAGSLRIGTLFLGHGFGLQFLLFLEFPAQSLVGLTEL